MIKEKAWKYATWLTMLAGTLVIPLVFLASDGPNVAKYWRDSIGPLAMVISFFILLLTAFSAPALADGAENEKSHPAWAGVICAYSLLGMFWQLFFGGRLYSNNLTMMWAVYIPGVVFSLNLGLAILIQIWLAVEGLGLSLRSTLPVSGLFAAWVCYALINCGDMRVVAISAVVDGLLLLSLPVLLVIDKCRKDMLERQKPQYIKNHVST
ncbi:MAG: hypothetical protein G01um101413_307 [Parcubacteria group bacterium Gr01-1014_13]|nr:MAG: hypothetical protein G01um101413_307 [Parcubacteria group bacterium Gr01-1014_13]